MSDHSKAQELQEIKDEMLELLARARKLVEGTEQEGSAKAYWLAHIRTALDKEHNYLGGSMCTMQEDIDEMASQKCLGCGEFECYGELDIEGFCACCKEEMEEESA